MYYSLEDVFNRLYIIEVDKVSSFEYHIDSEHLVTIILEYKEYPYNVVTSLNPEKVICTYRNGSAFDDFMQSYWEINRTQRTKRKPLFIIMEGE